MKYCIKRVTALGRLGIITLESQVFDFLKGRNVERKQEGRKRGFHCVHTSYSHYHREKMGALLSRSFSAMTKPGFGVYSPVCRGSLILCQEHLYMR